MSSNLTDINWKRKGFFVIVKAISESHNVLFDRPKSTKKALEPTDSRPPFIHPGLLLGRHHPWSFDWLPSVGFRSRPLFFIREKKRRRRYP
jgi:hypothetical protein